MSLDLVRICESEPPAMLAIRVTPPAASHFGKPGVHAMKVRPTSPDFSLFAR